jgi:hypothetical protein
MGRPKKIANSRSRSFLLPSHLLEQLEEAAGLRERDVSDVVREMLEESIEHYLKVSRIVRRVHQLESVYAAYADPLLREHFDRCLVLKKFELLPDSDLEQRQVAALYKGLMAHWKIEANPGELESAVVTFLAQFDALLQDVVSHGATEMTDMIVNQFRRLAILAGSPENFKVIREGGKLLLEVGKRIWSLLDDESLDLQTVESLRVLIRDNVLRRDMSGESGSVRRYQLAPL